MGNLFSISLSCGDAILSRCLDSLLPRAAYVRKLEDNLHALSTSLDEVRSVKIDVKRRVDMAERQRFMKRLDQVQLWIQSAEAIETQIDQVLTGRAQEIKKLCCGGCCSENYLSSYKYGKTVAKLLVEVNVLKNKGSFPEVAAESFDAAYERPSEPTVGMESMFDKVWKHVEDDQVGIIGLYGMGGVGKTTLLTKIHNKFLQTPDDFNLLIWIVVSKDHRLEIVQELIGESIGFSGDLWKGKKLDEKAQDIFRVLSKKKFLLFLDDIWEPVDMRKIGVPVPDIRNKSKIIFTTRSEDVCGQMEAKKKIKVDCLTPDKAWELFKEKVGREALQIHPDIPELAKVVANECDGLPLALITIGRAMACKKTPEAWNHAIRVLQESASEFSGMGDKVFPLLKYSYDNLPSDKARSCFLYCALFPEDFVISKDDLLYFWMCEDIFNKNDSFEDIKHECYDIIGTLLTACLLEDEANCVKMHDVIRDMALWVACDCGKENENILVHTGARRAPDVKRWKKAKRVSLFGHYIQGLFETPNSPNLLTLLLRGRFGSLGSFDQSSVNIIGDRFFDHMPTLRVLDLSCNHSILKLPCGISNLVSLQHLNLSSTDIRELPIQLKACVNLRYLNLECTHQLNCVPPNMISKFSRLKVLRMLECGPKGIYGDGILFDGDRSVIEEIRGLKHLEVLTLSVGSTSCFQSLFSYSKLVACTRTLHLEDVDSTVLDISPLVDMKHLESLFVGNIYDLEELEIVNQSYFLGLQNVNVSFCPHLKHLTWLIFAPNLSSLKISDCDRMEKIIDVGRFGGVANGVKEVNPFGKLTVLSLTNLQGLKIIYDSALTFPYLQKIEVKSCQLLKKLPLNSTSGQRSCNLVIEGSESWWNGLEWEDQDTANAFLPCFRPQKVMRRKGRFTQAP